MNIAAIAARCAFPAGPLDLAVSGGADSLALLILASATGQPVVAHHVDHGLRVGSDKEARFVADAAGRFGAAFVSHRVQVDGDRNVEANARAARYAVLPSDVLTGHTADDQAETMVLNLMRGAGVDGMAGMATASRPILQLRRTETEAICAAYEITPFHDPSNDDPQFARNRVRHELLPLMNEIMNRDVAAILARQARNFRMAIDALDEQVHTLDPRDARALADAPEAVATRALRAWLRTSLDDELHPPDSAAVTRVLDVAHGRAIACDVVNGWRVMRSSQRLTLVPPRAPGKSR